MVSITIKVPKTGALPDKFWRILERNKRVVEDKIKKILAEVAKDGHKGFKGTHYKNETYRLRDSTKAEGNLPSQSNYDDQIRLYVDLAEAPYGEYVIKGHGTWDGDPFINESVDANKEEITKLIKNLYIKSIREFNRSN